MAMMNEEKALAERIQRARNEAGLSQEELGTRLGIEQSTVSKIETGISEIGAIRLVRIATVLGRPVTWFLGLDTGLSDEESTVLHLWRQIETRALREQAMDILAITVRSDRELRGET